jgi:CHAT domain-containing protein/tetratricopeptide (TPR) repeat protein
MKEVLDSMVEHKESDDIQKIRVAIASAISKGNQEEEAAARMQLCSSLLFRNSDEAVEEFDNTLALLRRNNDGRRELILYLNFALYFLQKGQKDRAFKLAERSVKMAENSNKEFRIIALLNFAKVLTDGFNELRKGMELYRMGMQLLKEYIEHNPDGSKQLLNNLYALLVSASQTALKLNLPDEAADIIYLVDSAKAREVRKDSMQYGTNIPDLTALHKMRYPDLDPVLAAWRTVKVNSDIGFIQQNEILQRMKELAGILKWDEAETRLAQIPSLFESKDATEHGPGGLMQLTRMMMTKEITPEVAEQSAKKLQVSDDDLECLVLFTMQDTTLSKNGIAFMLLNLCAIIAVEPKVSARFYDALSIFSKDQESKLRYLLEADKRVSVGDYCRERAHIRNEAAVILAQLERNDESLDMASSAKKLADSVGDVKLAGMAANNMGLALMQMKRLEEAIAVFEPLMEMQKSINDMQGLEITQYNLSSCYLGVGRNKEAKFDEGSSDLDHLIGQALQRGLGGEYEQSIRFFESAFKIITAKEVPYDNEAKARANFARTLFSAGRLSDATEQMKMAASLFEKKRDNHNLHDAYSWLTTVTTDSPATSEYYAKRALELAQETKDPKTIANDLVHIGRSKLAMGQYAEAIKAVEEANRLVDDVDIKMNLADTLVDVGRPIDAISICEKILVSSEIINDKQKEVAVLLTMAKAQETLSEEQQQISLLHKAYSIAEDLGNDEIRLATADRLGFALLKRNKLNESAEILGKGVNLARMMGRSDLSLLNNLGNTLQALGDLEGAKDTLSYVLTESRNRGNVEYEITALFSLGNIAATQQQFDEALSCYLEAADISNEENNKKTEAACLDSIGVQYTFLHKPERAIEYHKRASKLHEELGLWKEKIIDIHNLIQAHIALNEVEQAAMYVAEAQNDCVIHGIKYSWEFLFCIGQVAALQGNWSEARTYFLRAIIELESIRHLLKTPIEKRKWSANKFYIYNLVAEAAIVASDASFAIEVIECNKARFLQSMMQRRMYKPHGVNENLWLGYEQASDRLSELQAQRRSRLFFEDSNLDEQIRHAETEFARANAALESASEKEFEELPEFEFPSWINLSQSIPLNYVAVSISIYSKGLGIVCMGRNKAGKTWAKAKMYQTFTRSDLNQLIFGDRQVIRSALKNGTLDRIQPEAAGWVLGSMLPQNTLWIKTISQVCTLLGNTIWPCILDTVPDNTNNLILMPSAGFNVLPLHAARLPNGSYVDERFQISYVPSLSILEQIMKHSQLSSFVNLGQAVNPTEDIHLPFSFLEAREVAKSHGLSKVKMLSGSKATVEYVLDLVNDSDIFHFSGHAFFSVLEPFHSGLLCNSKEKKFDILTLKTIFQRTHAIRSKLIILSACETGQVQADDVLNDYLGLPGGFIVAGANAVIATLWRVEDLSTCLLLEKFFDLWDHSGQSTPQALTAAQQWLRDDVTVEYVTKKLRLWLEDATDMGRVLEREYRRWLVRYDRDTKPFRDEIYWAAFYITGIIERHEL